MQETWMKEKPNVMKTYLLPKHQKTSRKDKYKNIQDVLQLVKSQAQASARFKFEQGNKKI